MRPGPQRPGSWNYGHQYIAWHLVETKSSLSGAADELSLYATESYWTGDGNALRRYTLRLDGFVSVNAPRDGGSLVTRPITFAGTGLSLNFATSAVGSVRVELQNPDGDPYPGFALADCPPLFGDTVDRAVGWDGGDLSRLAGKPVRLRDLPPALRSESDVVSRETPKLEVSLDRSLDELVSDIVHAALEIEHGNRTRAAARLGVSVRTVQRHLAASGEA